MPLVIPEINPEAIAGHDGIIANPNCSTIIAIVPLWPIHKQNRIKRLIAATYQAASGAGRGGDGRTTRVDAGASRGAVNTRIQFCRILMHSICFSHNSKIDPVTGYNEEETKMVQGNQEDLWRRRNSHQCNLRPCAGATGAFRGVDN